MLNQAVCNRREGAHLRLGRLISRFASKGPIVLGVDDTIKRRRGRRISAKGLYREPVHSSKSFFVKTSGLRWLSLMLLKPIARARHVWWCEGSRGREGPRGRDRSGVYRF